MTVGLGMTERVWEWQKERGNDSGFENDREVMRVVKDRER
jgi:hypothetical protein